MQAEGMKCCWQGPYFSQCIHSSHCHRARVLTSGLHRPPQSHIVAVFSEWVHWSWQDTHFQSAHTWYYLWKKTIPVCVCSGFGSQPCWDSASSQTNWSQSSLYEDSRVQQTTDDEPYSQSTEGVCGCWRDRWLGQESGLISQEGKFCQACDRERCTSVWKFLEKSGSYT